jgi:hypothetical protein
VPHKYCCQYCLTRSIIAPGLLREIFGGTVLIPTALKQLGVQIRLGTGATEVAPDHVLLSDGTKILTRTVIWAGGLKASLLSSNVGVAPGHGGRIDVQPDFSVKDFPTTARAKIETFVEWGWDYFWPRARRPSSQSHQSGEY